jgi:5-methylcytosine-specific restriction endonuclease McrA
VKRTPRINIKASVRNSVFERDGGKCRHCSGQLLYDEPWHIDHLKPLSKGGTNDETNLALSCIRCNLEKGAK